MSEGRGAPLRPSNPKIQRLRRLAGRRSARRDEGAFVIEGDTLLAEARAAGAPIEAVFATADWRGPGDGDGGDDGWSSGGPPVHLVEADVLAKAVSTVAPQAVAAIVGRIDVALDEVASADFVVVIAGLGDPGNVGTIIRSAAAAGAGAVVITAGSADAYNPKCVRATAGALFHVPLVVDAAAEALTSALGMRTFALAADGNIDLFDPTLDLTSPLALIVGHERHGLPADLKPDRTLSIPMAARIESLNAAMAATVAAFEVARQRRWRS